MSNNNLTILPENIYQLSNLKCLILENNKIEIISEKIKKLRLKTLFLTNNNLIFIPFEIKNIPQVFVNENSYQLNNLSSDCEIIIINDLRSKLHNLPSAMKEIHLYKPININVKLPVDCVLYVDGTSQQCPI